MSLMRSLRAQYDNLATVREGYLEQARLHSELTVPSLIPPDGTGENYQELYKPYQSVGAMGVNSLANKLTGALYPANEPFFKFEVVTTAEEFDEVPPEVLDGIDAQLAAMERSILRAFTARGDRSAIAEAMKHLIVAGNACLRISDKTSRVYSLDSFVCIRDGEGTLLKGIVKDSLSYETFKEIHPGKRDIHAAHEGNRQHPLKTIEVYTCIERRDGAWYMYEEAAGVVVNGSEQTHPLDRPPMLFLRFNKVYGQSYGRGYVENLYGDLRSLESLSKSLIEAAAIGARVITLVNPNGLTNMRLFEEAPNGGVIPGTANDITTAQTAKGADLAIAENRANILEARLKAAFMERDARNAERVTAEEIKETTREVENTLGGVYTVLSEEFQKPFVTRLISILKKTGKIPDWPEGALDISIVTGTAGIGRGIDRERLGGFLTALQQTLGGDTLQKYARPEVVISRLAASFGIDLQGLIKTPEELAGEQQQQTEKELTSQLGGPAIAAAGQVAREQIKQESSQDATSQEQPTQGVQPE